MTASAACVTRNVPSRLVSITSFHTGNGRFSTGRLGCVMPALLIRMSRRPNSRRTERNRSSTERGSRTSQECAKTRIFPPASSLLTFFRLDWSRAVRIKLHCSAARARAIARPMPRVAPVMRPTWPRRGAEVWDGRAARFLSKVQLHARSFSLRQPTASAQDDADFRHQRSYAVNLFTPHSGAGG